jgi:diacylglycerol kinase family enzyme
VQVATDHPSQTVLIAVNPTAGRKATRPTAEHLSAILRSRGYRAEIVTDLIQLGAQAQECCAAGALRAVVGAGGDGTIAELANRLPPDIPLAVLPLGTENLLAKYLGVGTDPEAVAEVVEHGVYVRLDAGRAVLTSGGESRGGSGRLFLLMASCGLDAEVVRRLAENRRGHIRHWSYAKPIWQSLRSYTYPLLRLRCWDSADPLAPESAAEVLEARWLFIQNLPCYALGMNFAPQACGADGQLDVCCFQKGSLLSGLGYLAAVVGGCHHKLPSCILRRARRIVVECDQPVAYQLDGDAGGRLPLQIHVVPRRVMLLVPRTWAGLHAQAVPDTVERG